MLVELAHWLATPATLRARRSGHLSDAIALLARARRCRAQWADHQRRTKDAILEAAAGADPAGAALVLGSGPLLDVPLAELSARFARVVLVDIVHLWPARLAMRRFPNVVRATADLTGLSPDGTIAPPIAALAAAHGASLVVSVNLLSQLPIVPVSRAAQPEADPLGRRIVEAHLAALTALDARVCLVTDTLQVEEDASGAETDRLHLLHGVQPPAARCARHTWTWELAPFGEASRRHRLIHHVVAYPDWHAAISVAECRDGMPRRQSGITKI